jgi:hypothetical protein
MIDPNVSYVSTLRLIGDPRWAGGCFRPARRPGPLRAIIENEIERLIAFLDRVDGDADIEANGDEGDYSC